MSNVFTVVAKIYPKAGNEREVEALLVKMADAVYRSREAFDFHRTAPHLAAYREQMKGLLDKPTEVEFYHSLTA